MFCPYCGSSLKDGMRFCPECGNKLPDQQTPSQPVSEPVSEPIPETPAYEAPVYEAPVSETPAYEAPTYEAPDYSKSYTVDDSFTQDVKAPKQKKKKKFPVALVAIIAAVVIIAVAVVAILNSGLLGSPLTKVAKAAANTVEAAGKSDLAQVLVSAGKEGSFSLSTDLEKAEIYNANGEVVLYVGEDGKAAALTANAEIDGEELDAAIYANTKEFAVECSQVLGKKAYGVNLEDIGSNLPKSIFAPDSGSSYALDEDTYEILLQLGDGMTGSEEFSEDAKDVLEAALTELLESIDKHAQVEKGSSELDFAGETTKCSSVLVTMDAEAFMNVCEDMLNWAKDDKDLKSFLKTYVDLYGAALEAEGEDPDSFIDDFYDGIDDTLDDLDDSRDEMEDEEIQMLLDFHMSGKQLVKVEVQGLQEDEEVFYGALTCGPDAADPSLLELEYDDGWDAIKVTYEVETNDKSEYSAKLKLTEDKEALATATISWDKSSSDFSVKAKIDDESASLKGTLELSSDALVLTTKKVSYEEEELSIPVTITVNAKDSMPDMPDYTDLCTFRDEEDFEDAINEIAENAGSLDALSSLMGGSYYDYSDDWDDDDWGDDIEILDGGDDAYIAVEEETVTVPSGEVKLAEYNGHTVSVASVPSGFEQVTAYDMDTSGFVIYYYGDDTVNFSVYLYESWGYDEDALYDYVDTYYNDASEDLTEDEGLWWTYPDTTDISGITFTYCWFDTLIDDQYESQLLMVADTGEYFIVMILDGYTFSEDDYYAFEDLFDDFVDGIVIR